jgi:hypothetical protein
MLRSISLLSINLSLATDAAVDVTTGLVIAVGRSTYCCCCCRTISLVVAVVAVIDDVIDLVVAIDRSNSCYQPI